NKILRECFSSGTTILWILALSLILIPQTDLNTQNTRGYYPEDWVSYTNMRFVRSVASGFNNVYFGTTEGIMVYDINFDEWLDPMTESDGLPDQNIRMLAVEPDDSRVYVNTSSGIYMYETTFKEWSQTDIFPSNLVDENLSLISNFQRYIPPVGYHAMSPNVIQDDELRDYPVVSAARGENGDIWLGTWGLGIGRIDSYGIEIDLMNYGLYTNSVHTMLKRGEKFYFGGRNQTGTDNALTTWERNNNKWEYYESKYNDSFISDKINDIEDTDKYIFMATDYGLARMNHDGSGFKSYYQPRNFATDLILSLEYTKGELFIGTDKGLYVMDVKGDSIQFMGGQMVASAAIFDIHAYKDDLWIGSDYGTVRFDSKTNKFYRYSSAGGVLLGITFDVEEDTRDGLWFATEDAIVWMNDKFEEQERFYVEAELDGYSPNRLLVHERYLWVATDYGVYRYDRKKHYWKHFTTADGLIDNMTYDLILDGDYLWIATENGVTRYYWNNPVRGEDI
ncbi:MAG: hypothetical protein GWO41_13005, partial [candidate division Zixibacteria bacterium]|nr:hypothetical protein [candidate division Zixibacteria bacterium]NIR66183.1 hypothetical protein [candidate division Zixibacteria bacterium]NIS17263.1 hypothetical protein [candidate division Zixibacteria bacterium]NIS47806.1 hypothetical protein [candidate division Zixibacteria bacterium]NIT53620.1 hypothetical protein [candidate division Zixibacteria bacterium]